MNEYEIVRLANQISVFKSSNEHDNQYILDNMKKVNWLTIWSFLKRTPSNVTVLLTMAGTLCSVGDVW